MDVYFKEIERPKTRATRHELSGYDLELEWAIRHTASTKKAIVVSLGEFHSSPAKSRLWGQGFSVRHRREGCVIKPELEQETWIGRKILRSINPEYLLKSESDFH